jgi:hypothetical protein
MDSSVVEVQGFAVSGRLLYKEEYADTSEGRPEKREPYVDVRIDGGGLGADHGTEGQLVSDPTWSMDPGSSFRRLLPKALTPILR